VHSRRSWLTARRRDRNRFVTARYSTSSATPLFYGLQTAEGIPYRCIAQFHSRDVPATTLLQTCIHFCDRSQSCQFCAIEQSLDDGQTLVRKKPEQVAETAVRLDGLRQLVLTTGTPNADDRGATMMAETSPAVKARVPLPIQAQCDRRGSGLVPAHSAGRGEKPGHAPGGDVKETRVTSARLVHIP